MASVIPFCIVLYCSVKQGMRRQKTGPYPCSCLSLDQVDQRVVWPLCVAILSKGKCTGSPVGPFDWLGFAWAGTVTA